MKHMRLFTYSLARQHGYDLLQGIGLAHVGLLFAKEHGTVAGSNPFGIAAAVGIALLHRIQLYLQFTGRRGVGPYISIDGKTSAC